MVGKVSIFIAGYTGKYTVGWLLGHFMLSHLGRQAGSVDTSPTPEGQGSSSYMCVACCPGAIHIWFESDQFSFVTLLVFFH